MSGSLTTEDLKKLNYKPTTSSVATEGMVNAIGKEWVLMGVPQDQMFQTAILLARMAADYGSSAQTTMLDEPLGNSTRTANELAAVVKKHCTFRQFCAYYAKYVWNMLLQTNTPPASWMDWEFRDSEKFAAFDFFYGVQSTAALEPPRGLVRVPTANEVAANVTNAFVKIVRATRANPIKITTAAEVTHGQVGPTTTYPQLEAP